VKKKSDVSDAENLECLSFVIEVRLFIEKIPVDVVLSRYKNKCGSANTSHSQVVACFSQVKPTGVDSKQLPTESHRRPPDQSPEYDTTARGHLYVESRTSLSKWLQFPFRHISQVPSLD
jgi:hypothetical protein